MDRKIVAGTFSPVPFQLLGSVGAKKPCTEFEVVEKQIQVLRSRVQKLTRENNQQGAICII